MQAACFFAPQVAIKTYTADAAGRTVGFRGLFSVNIDGGFSADHSFAGGPAWEQLWAPG